MKHKTKLHLYLIPITLYLFLWGCKKDLTPADNSQPAIKLTVEDVGVTEVWLKLETADSRPEDRITIQRNDSTIKQFNNSTSDTLIYDSGLLPNHYYTYTATLTSNQQQVTSSQQLTTMDTTSHNFTWQSWTFGAQGSSILYDVAIIDENNIWAVGEIYTEDTYTYDSLGNWIDPYNAVHWDGSEWELKRFYYRNNSGGQSIILPIRGIHVVNDNDIWFASGSIFHWNGNIASISYQRDITTNELVGRLWYNSDSEIYGIGNEGLIVYYNGLNWQRIKSGTESVVTDIWGTKDVSLNKQIIIVTVSDKFDVGDLKILSIDSLNVNGNRIKWPFLLERPYSIWFVNKNKLWVCGDGLFNYINNKWSEDKTIQTTRFLNRVRGKQLNSIFIVGDFGFISHFNGVNWKKYPEFGFASSYISLDYNGQLMTAVGFVNNEALILKMHRN